MWQDAEFAQQCRFQKSWLLLEEAPSLTDVIAEMVKNNKTDGGHGDLKE